MGPPSKPANPVNEHCRIGLLYFIVLKSILLYFVEDSQMQQDQPRYASAGKVL